jgi:hypothetical protein
VGHPLPPLPGNQPDHQLTIDKIRKTEAQARWQKGLAKDKKARLQYLDLSSADYANLSTNINRYFYLFSNSFESSLSL